MIENRGNRFMANFCKIGKVKKNYVKTNILKPITSFHFELSFEHMCQRSANICTATFFCKKIMYVGLKQYIL